MKRSKISNCVSLFVVGMMASFSASAASTTDAKAPAPTGKVRYKQGKDVRFDSLLINGALQRPDTLMVTGDAAHESNGILKLRQSFRDRMLADSGSELSKESSNGDSQ